MDKLAAYSLILAEHPLWQEKVATPRQIKVLRNLVSSGRVDEAKELARTLSDAGVLKKSLAGTTLKSLGGGAEGPAHLTVGALDAPTEFSVRKMFDRGAASFDKKMLGEKFNMFRRARKDPNVSTVYSPRIRKGSKGTPYYHMEHVDGGNIKGWPDRFLSSTAGEGTSGISAQMGLMSGGEFGMGKKKLMTDVLQNPSNTLLSRDGTPKIIDFIPSSEHGAARAFSASDPKSRFIQERFLGMEPRRTAKSVEEGVQDMQRMVAELQSDPNKMRRAEKLQDRAVASQFQNLWGNPNLQPSDWVAYPEYGGAKALRKSDAKRTLRGM